MSDTPRTADEWDQMAMLAESNGFDIAAESHWLLASTMRKLAAAQAALAEAERRGREAGMREAAKIAGNWASGHCHGETADEYRILADLRAAILAAIPAREGK